MVCGGRRGSRKQRRRKLGHPGTHFLLILLFSERPSLGVMSSEPESVSFFGRAAGIRTARSEQTGGDGGRWGDRGGESRG